MRAVSKTFDDRIVETILHKDVWRELLFMTVPCSEFRQRRQNYHANSPTFVQVDDVNKILQCFHAVGWAAGMAPGL